MSIDAGGNFPPLQDYASIVGEEDLAIELFMTNAASEDPERRLAAAFFVDEVLSGSAAQDPQIRKQVALLERDSDPLVSEVSQELSLLAERVACSGIIKALPS